MLEVTSAIIAFLGAQILFARTNVGEKLTPWKSIGFSIVVIICSIFVFSALGSKYYSIVIVPTIICSVMVSSRYQEYLTTLQDKLYKQKRRRDV